MFWFFYFYTNSYYGRSAWVYLIAQGSQVCGWRLGSCWQWSGGARHTAGQHCDTVKREKEMSENVQPEQFLTVRQQPKDWPCEKVNRTFSDLERLSTQNTWLASVIASSSVGANHVWVCKHRPCQPCLQGRGGRNVSCCLFTGYEHGFYVFCDFFNALFGVS